MALADDATDRRPELRIGQLLVGRRLPGFGVRKLRFGVERQLAGLLEFALGNRASLGQLVGPIHVAIGEYQRLGRGPDTGAPTGPHPGPRRH